MAVDGTYGVDPFNPRNVEGMMDQPLVSEYWFNQFAEPRISKAMVSNPHLTLTQSSPNPDPIFPYSSPHRHLILTSPHPHLTSSSPIILT